MRFALEDSSDDDSVSSLDYSISSEDEVDLTPSRNPRSNLGRNILNAYETSEDDLDSEDEVNLGLDDEWDVVKTKAREGPSWREKKEKSVKKDIKGKGKSKMVSSLSYTVLTPRKHSSVKIEDVGEERENQYDLWLKTADQEAWRDGQKQATERRGQIRNIATNARARLQSQEQDRLAKEAEELRKMLEGMTMKHSREEQEMEKQFKEREKKLWEDIDAAIKEVERREAELAAATVAAAQRQKAEEDARRAQAEKLALAHKAEEDKRAKEHAEKERQAQVARDQEEQRKAAADQAVKEEEEAKAKVAAEKDRAGGEWRKWVEKQKWMKINVIEPVKGDRSIKTALRAGMRLMTRGLGQVVNTQESIVRVTNDLHAILSEQLPSPPSPSSPAILTDELPKPYAYLLSHLSKALIKQAESEVNAKADAAFPLARIVMGLVLRGHAALGEVLFARFVKKCPWVVPYYPTRDNNQPREEYEKSTGRGSDESLAEYISRMAGICTLYFAILQTPLSSLIPTATVQPPTPTQLETLIVPPLRFPSAWTWLALSLKDQFPALPPVAHLVSSWIEIVAHEAVNRYGRGQMGKIWEAIEREGLGQGKIKGDSEAARQRLGLVLEKWRRGEVEVPKGRVWE
ncbi:hypothetical protein I302_100243 [Kwoniella bestiolae CBS 10118]|uniref:mRNA export factor GLE1 n=1 Tax=Kwoniella bestiolae CBS 10118 TaxID=1296100 RepID=A0A1B9G4L9_9TREE|nr:hypothetical protein I302_03617 [Kwoniella bestiolae CBS 10118]OCF25940.1 hypothetical protein I302_03617 [Kwoniella bestiolae CBS 10118]